MKYIKWDLQKELLLLKELKDHEHLWKSADNNFKNNKLKKKAYEEIAITMKETYPDIDFNHSTIKSKIFTLKTMFYRERKRIAKYRTESDAEDIARWPLYNSMLFLLDTIDPCDSYTNLLNQEHLEFQDIMMKVEDNFEVDEQNLTIEEMNNRIAIPAKMNNSIALPVKVKIRKTSNNNLETKIKISNKDDETCHKQYSKCHYIKWDIEKEYAFIKAIKSCKVIWNVKDNHYKNMMIKKMAFEEVANTMKAAFPDLLINHGIVKAKFYSLKKQFFKERNRILECGDADGVKSASKWPLYKLMLFLLDSTEPDQLHPQSSSTSINEHDSDAENIFINKELFQPLDSEVEMNENIIQRKDIVTVEKDCDNVAVPEDVDTMPQVSESGKRKASASNEQSLTLNDKVLTNSDMEKGKYDFRSEGIRALFSGFLYNLHPRYHGSFFAMTAKAIVTTYENNFEKLTDDNL